MGSPSQTSSGIGGPAAGWRPASLRAPAVTEKNLEGVIAGRLAQRRVVASHQSKELRKLHCLDDDLGTTTSNSHTRASGTLLPVANSITISALLVNIDDDQATAHTVFNPQ